MKYAIVFLAATALCAQAPKDSEWPTYTADLAGTRYRPLDQINASNFSKLEIAGRSSSSKEHR
jgi:quinoprotein glucose dehydrogenase